MLQDNQHCLLSEFLKIAATTIQQSQSLTKQSLASFTEKLEHSDKMIPLIDKLDQELQEDPKKVNALRSFFHKTML